MAPVSKVENRETITSQERVCMANKWALMMQCCITILTTYAGTTRDVGGGKEKHSQNEMEKEKEARADGTNRDKANQTELT